MPVGTVTCTSSVDAADTWVYWTSTATTSTAGTATIWSNWITTSNTATTTSTAVYAQPRRMSAAEAAAQAKAYAEAQQAADERYAAERQKRVKAEARAKKLLEENLALRERDTLRKHGHFIVHGRSGVRYRIRTGRSANVDVVDGKGFITHRLCAHPAAYVPDYDTMLAQKLMLETDDEAFARIANRHFYTSREPVLPALQ